MSSQPTMYICTDLAKYCLFERISKERKDGKAFNMVPHCTKDYNDTSDCSIFLVSGSTFSHLSEAAMISYLFFFQNTFLLLDFVPPSPVYYVLRIVLFYCCNFRRTWSLFLFSFEVSWCETGTRMGFRRCLCSRSPKQNRSHTRRTCCEEVRRHGARLIYTREFDEGDKSRVFLRVLGCLGLCVSTI